MCVCVCVCCVRFATIKTNEVATLVRLVGDPAYGITQVISFRAMLVHRLQRFDHHQYGRPWLLLLRHGHDRIV